MKIEEGIEGNMSEMGNVAVLVDFSEKRCSIAYVLEKGVHT